MSDGLRERSLFECIMDKVEISEFEAFKKECNDRIDSNSDFVDMLIDSHKKNILVVNELKAQNEIDTDFINRLSRSLIQTRQLLREVIYDLASKDNNLESILKSNDALRGK